MTFVKMVQSYTRDGGGRKNKKRTIIIIGDGKGIQWQAETKKWYEVGLKVERTGEGWRERIK